MAFSRITQIKDIPRGCERRKAIENPLLYNSDRELRDTAMREYGDLLQTELALKTQQPDKVSAIQRRFKHVQYGSYTDYSRSLTEKYPNSYLMKIIFLEYKHGKSTSVRELQQAMVDFENLMEVQTMYLQLMKPIGASKSYYQTPNRAADVKQIHSNTIHGPPGHPRDDRQTMSVSQTPLKIEGNVYYPEFMYKQLETRSQQQQSDIATLQNDIKAKTKELNELRNRLSGLASKQLTQGNPDFTDLSDKNRPMKIAEFFHTVYDDEWTTALEALTRGRKGSASQTEEEAIQFLMEIIKCGYSFCSNYAEKQKRVMKELWISCLNDPFKSAYSVDPPQSGTQTATDTMIDCFKEMRRARPDECIKTAVKAFKENVLQHFGYYKTKKLPEVDAFADKCIKVIWLMRIQDPPMFMQWPEYSDKFNPDIYKEYCRKGSVVKLAVWPAVFLHENGALMNKGFVMPK